MEKLQQMGGDIFLFNLFEYKERHKKRLVFAIAKVKIKTIF